MEIIKFQNDPKIFLRKNFFKKFEFWNIFSPTWEFLPRSIYVHKGKRDGYFFCCEMEAIIVGKKERWRKKVSQFSLFTLFLPDEFDTLQWTASEKVKHALVSIYHFLKPRAIPKYFLV